MSKRPWIQMYEEEAFPGQSYPPQPVPSPPAPRPDNVAGSGSSPNMPLQDFGEIGVVPTLSRKIKACAACRKHKVKCLIHESGPPCHRCAKHGLECILNRNLQTIIDDNVQYSEAIFEDLESIHEVLRELVHRAGLPNPKVLQTTVLRRSTRLQGVDSKRLACRQAAPSEVQKDISRPSRDSSPETSPDDDPGLSRVPIQSLYALTRLKSLRSPNVTDEQHSPAVHDFIAGGAVREEVAEDLFRQFRDRLDAFIYNIGCRYQTLGETRKKSPILTAAILTVAALHDSQSEDTYSICNAELRRLISLAMFDRRVSRDYLRAMCVASYWLSDIWWMISGHAIRLASECDLHNQLSQSLRQQSEEAADGARLWFILRVCDQRLATLYGRPAIVHEESSVDQIESFLQSPISNEQDRRIMGQVTLLSIFKSIRELFGPDRGKTIPRTYLHQISHFKKQLDNWRTHWSGTVSEQYDHIGVFPRKAVNLHYQFAKLHLDSHIFRGLSVGEDIPHYFMDCAAGAISAATSTIEFILCDPDVAAVVVGIPSYWHCMTAFACTFLFNIALKYSRDLIDPEHVWGLTTRLVQHLKSMNAGKWHLTKLMVPGLERMASILDPTREQHGGDIDLWQRDISNANTSTWFDNSHLFDYSMNVGLFPLLPFEMGVSSGVEI